MIDACRGIEVTVDERRARCTAPLGLIKVQCRPGPSTCVAHDPGVRGTGEDLGGGGERFLDVTNWGHTFHSVPGRHSNSQHTTSRIKDQIMQQDHRERAPHELRGARGSMRTEMYRWRNAGRAAQKQGKQCTPTHTPLGVYMLGAAEGPSGQTRRAQTVHGWHRHVPFATTNPGQWAGDEKKFWSFCLVAASRYSVHGLPSTALTTRALTRRPLRSFMLFLRACMRDKLFAPVGGGPSNTREERARKALPSGRFEARSAPDVTPGVYFLVPAPW